MAQSQLAQARADTYMRNKNTFIHVVDLSSMDVIDKISTTDNPYLYPFYLNFKELMRDYTTGVFILDARGTYTPIENGRYGVVHVERLPIVKPAVYGITDLSKCAVLTEREDDDERIIIFQGVAKMPGSGWRFIDESFQVKPIAGFSATAVKRMILMREGPKKDPKKAVVVYDDDDDELPPT